MTKREIFNHFLDEIPFEREHEVFQPHSRMKDVYNTNTPTLDPVRLPFMSTTV